jgi:hypothetical protein
LPELPSSFNKHIFNQFKLESKKSYANEQKSNAYASTTSGTGNSGNDGSSIDEKHRNNFKKLLELDIKNNFCSTKERLLRPRSNLVKSNAKE